MSTKYRSDQWLGMRVPRFLSHPSSCASGSLGCTGGAGWWLPLPPSFPPGPSALLLLPPSPTLGSRERSDRRFSPVSSAPSLALLEPECFTGVLGLPDDDAAGAGCCDDCCDEGAGVPPRSMTCSGGRSMVPAVTATAAAVAAAAA